MFKNSVKTAIIAGVFAVFFSCAANASVNKSVKISAGSQTDGASSVNGNVTVGEAAIVDGRVETVNGTVRVDNMAQIRDASTVNGALKIGSSVKADDVSTVNGSIRIGNDSTITGEVSAVNGRIQVGQNTTVEDDVSNVNGAIDLDGSRVGGDLTTVNGDVELMNAAVLGGDLRIEKPNGRNWKENDVPRVVIGPGSRVEGVIFAEREIELFISESAHVGGVEGEASMDGAVRFSGDRP